ncbi:hypothetical protein OBBRIDRAFT_710077, partial [Obba rivulosa]
LTMRWVPGHSDIHGNEMADIHAKRAAAGESSDKSCLPPGLLKKGLPSSCSSTKQTFATRLKAHAREQWTQSPRYARLRTIDPTLPSPAYGKLIE